MKMQLFSLALALSLPAASAFSTGPAANQLSVRQGSLLKTAHTPFSGSKTPLFSSVPADALIGNDEYHVFTLPATDNQMFSMSKAATAFAATVGTYFLNNAVGMGPIMACSSVAVTASLFLNEKMALAALCGAFAGMASNAVIPNFGASVVLGLSTAGMLSLFDRKKWLVGLGGRLGFIAQCACSAQFVLTTICKPASLAGTAALASGVPVHFAKAALDLPTVACFTAMGALTANFLKRAIAEASWELGYSSRSSYTLAGKLFLQALSFKTKKLGHAVGAVGLTGLLAGSLLPASLAAPVFCGSFIAMSAPKNVPNDVSMLWAGILAGAAQISLSEVMIGGWGGKLGTAALMGTGTYTAIQRMRQVGSSSYDDDDDDALELPEVTMSSTDTESIPNPASVPTNSFVTELPKSEEPEIELNKSAAFTVVTTDEDAPEKVIESKESSKVVEVQDFVASRYYVSSASDFNI